MSLENAVASGPPGSSDTRSSVGYQGPARGFGTVPPAGCLPPRQARGDTRRGTLGLPVAHSPAGP
jgi:hypothetical protein